MGGNSKTSCLPWLPLLQTYPPMELHLWDCQYRPLGRAGVGEGIHCIPRHMGGNDEESLTSASADICPGSHAEIPCISNIKSALKLKLIIKNSFIDNYLITGIAFENKIL